MTVPSTIAGWMQGYQVSVADIEGTMIKPSGLLIGSRSGPKRNDMSTVVHEMAHLIEIDDERAFQRGFGLNVRQVEVAGQLYDEPFTFRELRVMAMQMSIQEHLTDVGNFDPLSWASLWKFMPGSFALRPRLLDWHRERDAVPTRSSSTGRTTVWTPSGPSVNSSPLQPQRTNGGVRA